MTVRVDEALLEEIRAAARKEDRSLSAYVLRVLREHLAAQAALEAPPRKATRSAMGALRHLGAPESIDDFREARREASRSAGERVDRTATILGRK